MYVKFYNNLLHKTFIFNLILRHIRPQLLAILRDLHEDGRQLRLKHVGTLNNKQTCRATIWC